MVLDCAEEPVPCSFRETRGEAPMSDDFPVQGHVQHPPREPMVGRRIRVAAAVIWNEGRILLTQRPPGGPLGGMWEFPGGKIEPGESPEHAIAREIHEELGVSAHPLEVIEVDTHDYEHGLEVELWFVRCELDSHAFLPSAAIHATRWILPGEIALTEVLAGDREFLRSLGAR
jgi:8-oxo-dGTP diphosphatase